MAKTITINGVNFTELTGQKAHALVQEYRSAEKRGCYRLWQVYDRFSQAKADAYDRCLSTMYRLGGFGYYISGYNTCQFCFVYIIRRENDKVFIVKETANNRYICETYIQALR